MNNRQEIMNRIYRAEDAARNIRSRMKTRTTAVTPSDITDLSSALIQGLQAVGEALSAINTSGWRA